MQSHRLVEHGEGERDSRATVGESLVKRPFFYQFYSLLIVEVCIFMDE